jgi:uncharacterized membrane protein YfcA
MQVSNSLGRGGPGRFCSGCPFARPKIRRVPDCQAPQVLNFSHLGSRQSLAEPTNSNIEEWPAAVTTFPAQQQAGNVIDATTLYVLLIVFVATLIRSAFGFGEALIAVPLLALCLPVGIAAPLAVLLSITIAGVIVVQDWRKIHFRSAGWLVASTLFGIPLGLLLLTGGPQQAVKAVLAIVILAFSVYSLLGRKPPELRTDSRVWLLGCGLCAGILGGAYGMNGPPLVIYGAMRRWPAQHFRATLQAYFLPASVIGMGGYWLAGLWVPRVTHYYAVSLPLVLGAIWLGRVMNQRLLRGAAFLTYVHIALVATGAVLLIQALSK